MTHRRPGPRTDLDVRAALLDAAEDLYAREGTDNVSLRAVARAVPVAPAALNHYFASKDALVEEVVRRRGDEFAAHTRAGLMALADVERPDLGEVVRAILDPYVAVVSRSPVGGLRWVKMFSALAMQQHPIWVAMVEAEPHLGHLVDAILARAMPDLPPEVIEARAAIAMFAMVTGVAQADLPAYGVQAGPDGLNPGFVDELVAFAVAGLSRPADLPA